MRAGSSTISGTCSTRTTTSRRRRCPAQCWTAGSGRPFYVDLVFYHFLLKCFVLVDLKAGELTHRDIGQMDLYVRLFDDKWRGEGDGPTLGIILCAQKGQAAVRYSVLKESRQLFASTYQLYLPTAEELSERLGVEVREARCSI